MEPTLAPLRAPPVWGQLVIRNLCLVVLTYVRPAKLPLQFHVTAMVLARRASQTMGRGLSKLVKCLMQAGG